MKKTLYFAAALLISACGQQENTVAEPKTDLDMENSESISEEPLRTKRDAQADSMPAEAKVQLASFNGNWFSVDYPENFTASPNAPIQTHNNYKFIETDEARFTSPDGTVEFFVFSPLWSGNPKDYLAQKSNEKIVSSSEDKASSDDPFAVSHKWVTYEDKDGKYTRAYHSLMTESTHHVFGIKYTNRKMYERYKAAYLAFKKSLQQFAD